MVHAAPATARHLLAPHGRENAYGGGGEVIEIVIGVWVAAIALAISVILIAVAWEVVRSVFT